MSTAAALRTDTKLAFEDYLEIDAVHATGLKDLLVSPRLYKARREQPREDTDTLRGGRANHTAVLEPDTFLLNYLCWRKSDGIRRGAKWEAFKASAGDRTIITEEQYRTAIAVRDAVRSHKVAKVLLSDSGRAEASIRWTHARTGLACKSRLDWWGSALVDLKTTRDPSPRKFAADAARLGYAMQLAFYADAVASVGGGAPPVKIIAAQSVEPFDVVVYSVDEATLAIGRQQYEEAIDLLIRCKESNSWPGMSPDEEVELRLPAWASPEADEEPLTFGGQAVF